MRKDVTSEALRKRLYRERLKQNPELYQEFLAKQQVYQKRHNAKKLQCSLTEHVHDTTRIVSRVFGEAASLSETT
jgi:hypothetical protein